VLQLKNLEVLTVGEKVPFWDEKIQEELEGVPGGRAWFAGPSSGGQAAENLADLTKQL